MCYSFSTLRALWGGGGNRSCRLERHRWVSPINPKNGSIHYQKNSSIFPRRTPCGWLPNPFRPTFQKPWNDWIPQRKYQQQLISFAFKSGAKFRTNGWVSLKNGVTILYSRLANSLVLVVLSGLGVPLLGMILLIGKIFALQASQCFMGL